MRLLLYYLEELPANHRHDDHGHNATAFIHSQTILGDHLYRYRPGPDIIQLQVYEGVYQGNEEMTREGRANVRGKG